MLKVFAEDERRYTGGTLRDSHSWNRLASGWWGKQNDGEMGSPAVDPEVELR